MNIRLLSTLGLACGLLMPAAQAVEFDPGGDLRAGFFARYRDDRDGSDDTLEDLRARIRLGLLTTFSDQVSAKVRVAGRYASKNNHNFSKFFQEIPASDGLRLGDSTVDELYVRYQPDHRWDLRLGRMQTKFELMGIPRKSLTRNDSPNTDITWTDGLFVKYHAASGWNVYTILQRSTDDGPTTVRRKPLGFEESASHVTYYLGTEKIDKHATLVQRGFDITYIPDSLQKDGTASGRIENYTGISGKLAAQWPLQSLADKLLVGGELAWAPKTPTEEAVKTGTSGDADGYAFQLSANLLDIRPGHSFGMVYMRSEGGWLLSADIGSNQHLLEGRYKWQINKQQKLEFRLRERDDLEKQNGAKDKRKDLDYYLRYTVKF